MMTHIVFAAMLAVVAAEPVKLIFNNPNGTLGDNVAPDAWKDYYVVAPDDESNLYFEVNSLSDRADALGVYIFDSEIPPHSERLNPGAYLDFDESTSIKHKSVRKYALSLGQCYIMKGTRYYLAVHGGPKEEGKTDPFYYTVSAKLVPSRLKHNMTTSGSLCDQRFLHYFYEVKDGGKGKHLQTTLRKTSGDLDSFYVRYEKCAGPSGSNLEKVSVEGHGIPQGTSYYPAPGGDLVPGRYYISVKGKMENCGKYDLSIIEFSGSASTRYMLVLSTALLAVTAMAIQLF